MIELEDNVTIGGSAVLMSHYAMHGLLVIDKLKMRFIRSMQIPQRGQRYVYLKDLVK